MQLQSLEALLAGSLRRENIADTRRKELEAEIEQLNYLVSLYFFLLSELSETVGH